jgi:hypothetical protein
MAQAPSSRGKVSISATVFIVSLARKSDSNFLGASQEKLQKFGSQTVFGQPGQAAALASIYGATDRRGWELRNRSGLRIVRPKYVMAEVLA